MLLKSFYLKKRIQKATGVKANTKVEAEYYLWILWSELLISLLYTSLTLFTEAITKTIKCIDNNSNLINFTRKQNAND